VNTDQLIRRTGLSFRQVDYWCDKGYLRPDAAHPGTGYARNFTADEVRVAGVMKRLVDAGLRVDVAERVARGHEEIAPGIEVLVDRDKHPDGPTSREIRRAAALVKREIVRSPKARRIRALREAQKVGAHS